MYYLLINFENIIFEYLMHFFWIYFLLFISHLYTEKTYFNRLTIIQTIKFCIRQWELIIVTKIATKMALVHCSSHFVNFKYTSIAINTQILKSEISFLYKIWITSKHQWCIYRIRLFPILLYKHIICSQHLNNLWLCSSTTKTKCYWQHLDILSLRIKIVHFILRNESKFKILSWNN